MNAQHGLKIMRVKSNFESSFIFNNFITADKESEFKLALFLCRTRYRLFQNDTTTMNKIIDYGMFSLIKS